MGDVLSATVPVTIEQGLEKRGFALIYLKISAQHAQIG